MNWQIIFDQSKANGAAYGGESLPYQICQWPENTWLQQRRREVRAADKKESPWPMKTAAAVSTANPVEAEKRSQSEHAEALKAVVSDGIRHAINRGMFAESQSDQAPRDHEQYRHAA
jgi:hypothetical protein